MEHESTNFSYGRISLLLSLCLSLGLFLSCDNDSDDDVTDEDNDCSVIGDQDSCICNSGLPGIRTCYPDLTYSACKCESKEEMDPCKTPGEEYACTCEDGESGILYCQNDLFFSECFCDGGNGSASSPSGSGSGGDDGCPEPYNCAVQEDPPISICVDATDLPPFCDNNEDCADLGLEGAQCLDPGVGMEVCIYRCD